VRYRSGGAFRAALEERLNAWAAGHAVSHSRLRKLVTFERFVARLQTGGDERWLLKGGFALQLRLGDRARTTRDVDISVNLGVSAGTNVSVDRLSEELGVAATRDLGDFFVFEVGACRELPLQVGPVRAYRYPVKCLLAGKSFERFHVDAGVGDPVVAPPVDLPDSGRLDFAGLPRVTFRAIAPEQHFAEKVHALTLPREGRENSRTRDLADLMLLLDLGLGGGDSVRAAVHGVFNARKTHPLPEVLEDPPAFWNREYEALAAELGQGERTLETAMTRLRDYWRRLRFFTGH